MQSYIIDGSNVVREIMGYERELKWKYLRELDNKRSTFFLHCLMRWAYRKGAGGLLRVCFDGGYRNIVPRRQRYTLGVFFSPAEPADNLIVQEVQAAADAGDKVTVITADGMLSEIVRALGASVMTPRDLDREICSAGIDLHRFDGTMCAASYGYA